MPLFVVCKHFVNIKFQAQTIIYYWYLFLSDFNEILQYMSYNRLNQIV